MTYNIPFDPMIPGHMESLESQIWRGLVKGERSFRIHLFNLLPLKDGVLGDMQKILYGFITIGFEHTVHYHEDYWLILFQI